MPTVKIGRTQVAAIMANLVFGKAIGYSSEIMARTVTNDAWLAMAISFATGFVIIAAVTWLAARFGEETPASYIPRLLGRPLGAVALLLLSLFFLGSFVTSANTVTQHINDYLMTETPMLVFVVLYTLLIMYGSYLGIEVAARLAVPGLGLVVLLNLLVVAGALDHMEYDRLLPLFDHGVLKVMWASIPGDTDVAMATTAALLLLPLTGKPDRWLRISWWGLGIGAVLTLTWPIMEVGVLGSELIGQYLIACMQLARAAELSIYLHRYEMIMVVLFVFSVVTQSVICLYSSCELLSAAVPWKLRRSWLYLGVGLVSMAIQYPLAYDREEYAEFLSRPWPILSLPVAFGLPLLLCVVSLLRPGVKPARSPVAPFQ